MGNSYNIALTDSNIFMSGVNTRGQFLNFSNLVSQNYMTALTGVPTLKSLTTGGSGTVCGLRASDNQIVCWGDSGHGQAGTSSLTNYFGFRPIYTTGFTSVSAIGVSDAHACAVNSGSTYCWGWAQAGRLSIGTVVNTSTPTLVKEGSNTTNLTAVSASFTMGSLSQCAITTDNLVKCWGYNTYGQVGAGDNSSNYNYARTVKINSTTQLTGITQVAHGGFHVCALNSSKQVYCWGYNNVGQVGQGNNTTSYYAYAMPVSGFSSTVGQRVASLSAGLYHTCALLENGDVRCWGRNGNGQLGDGGTTSIYSPPTTTASSLTGFSQISAGYDYTCGVKSNVLYCWGLNTSGQLGIGTTTSATTPQALSISEAQTITEIQTYQQSACAIINSSTTTGKVYCWGSNSTGAVGKSSVGTYTTPQVVMQYPGLTTAISGVTKLSIGNSALGACLIMSSGQVQCSGGNTSGLMADPTNPDFTTINVISSIP